MKQKKHKGLFAERTDNLCKRGHDVTVVGLIQRQCRACRQLGQNVIKVRKYKQRSDDPEGYARDKLAIKEKWAIQAEFRRLKLFEIALEINKVRVKVGLPPLKKIMVPRFRKRNPETSIPTETLARMSRDGRHRPRINKHGYKGVKLGNGHFYAVIRIGGKLHYIGSYETAAEAGAAYQAAVEKLEAEENNAKKKS